MRQPLNLYPACRPYPVPSDRAVLPIRQVPRTIPQRHRPIPRQTCPACDPRAIAISTVPIVGGYRVSPATTTPPTTVVPSTDRTTARAPHPPELPLARAWVAPTAKSQPNAVPKQERAERSPFPPQSAHPPPAPATHSNPPPSPQPPDTNAIAAQVERQMMRKLAIERERRGKSSF